MSDDAAYQPISCALHSEYELAIMHKRTLRLSWKEEDGNIRSEAVIPLDLQTTNHQEFLVGNTMRDEPLKIRLDHILNIEILE